MSTFIRLTVSNNGGHMKEVSIYIFISLLVGNEHRRWPWPRKIINLTTPLKKNGYRRRGDASPWREWMETLLWWVSLCHSDLRPVSQWVNRGRYMLCSSWTRHWRGRLFIQHVRLIIISVLNHRLFVLICVYYQRNSILIAWCMRGCYYSETCEFLQDV